MTLLQFNTLFLKPAFYIESMNWTERVKSDPTFLCNNKKYTGRHLSPLSKSEQGKMIKKGEKNICTAVFNKVMKLQSCVWDIVYALAKQT